MVKSRPTIEEWIEIVYGIYDMEKISFSIKVEKEQFYKIWTKWTEYVKPISFDYICVLCRPALFWDDVYLTWSGAHPGSV